MWKIVLASSHLRKVLQRADIGKFNTLLKNVSLYESKFNTFNKENLINSTASIQRCYKNKNKVANLLTEKTIHHSNTATEHIKL